MGNEIRLGKVSAVDNPAGMVRVVYHEKDDDVTRMIPILSTVFSGVYSMPEVGDQVLVLHLSNGSEAGVVLGRPWSEKTKPPEGAEKLYRLDMDRAPGVAMVRYDGKAKDLTIHCDGTLNITAGGAITINGKTIDLNDRGPHASPAPAGCVGRGGARERCEEWTQAVPSLADFATTKGGGGHAGGNTQRGPMHRTRRLPTCSPGGV